MLGSENITTNFLWGDYTTKFKDKITLRSKDAYVDNMLVMLGMESCIKRRPRDAGRLRGRDVSVSCGHLDVFQETPFRLA